MATLRLYLNNAAATYSPATLRGTWHKTSDAVTKKMSTSKDASGSPTTVTGTHTGTAYQTALLLRLVSEPMAAAMSIASGETWNSLIGCLEDLDTMNLQLRLHCFVTVGDSDTVRGTILSNATDSAEMATVANQCAEQTADTYDNAVSIAAGDRIVLELGMGGNCTDSTNYGDIYYGGSGNDLVFNNGDATTLVGWVDIVYMDGPPGMYYYQMNQ